MKPGEIIPAKAPDLDANVGLKEITLEVANTGDRPPVARALHDLIGDDGDRLGVIEFQAACLSAAGEVGGDDDQEFFAFAREEMHGFRPGGECGRRRP